MNKLSTRSSILQTLITLFVCIQPCAGQLPTCTGASAGLIYFWGTTSTHANAIFNLDPTQPISATNPSINTITVSGGTIASLSVGPNLNAAGPSPTFYVVGTNFDFHYYNGSTWVNTGYNAGAGASNPGSGAHYIYNLAIGSGNVYKYDGTGNATLLTTASGIVGQYPASDVTADCADNFYVLKFMNPATMYEYNSSGTLINTFTVTGIAPGITGAGGIAVLNGYLYFDATASGGVGLYGGPISGSTVAVTLLGILPTGSADFATCPSGTGTLTHTTTSNVCPGVGGSPVTIGGHGPYTWNVVSGPAVITGNSATVTVATTANAVVVGQSDTIGSCAATYVDTFNIITGVSNFTVANTAHCPGDVIAFANTSTQVPTSAAWNFGDGATSGNISPTHVYSAAGNYTVTLINTYATGCMDTITRPAYIHITRPHAAFTESDSTGICIPTIVTFTNGSTNAATYNWSFGNTNASTATNPVNPYGTPGNYTVQMIATDVNGCADTAYHSVVIYGGAGTFSYTPELGCAPLTVSFTANVTGIPGIAWNFGDGANAASSTSHAVTHIYTVGRKYIPQVVLTDAAGCHTTVAGTDTIRVDKTTAAFTESAACLNDTVQFTDASSGIFAPANRWSWNTGDGGASALQDPVHVYHTTGSFPVVLIATNGTGCVDTFTNMVTVHSLPVITAHGDTTLCPGDTAFISAKGGLSYLWAPAPSIPCPTCNPTYVVPVVAGNYIVTGTDANGCHSKDTVNIKFTYKTIAYAGGDSAICVGRSITLSDSGGQTYQWYPAAQLIGSNTAHPLANPTGSITYMVVAQTGHCAPDTNYVNITVHPLPKLTATGATTVPGGSTVNLQASGPNITAFSWNHADLLNCSDCVDPIATVEQTTIFTVTATNQYGCADSASVQIDVVCDKSQVFIPNTFTPNGDGQNDVFYPRGTGIKTVLSFRIYDRWGELVFERRNIDLNDEHSGWDGSYKGSKLSTDTYVYVLNAVCDEGQHMDWKGSVTMIR